MLNILPYWKIINEYLLCTAQQNIAQRGHNEKRNDIESVSDMHKGNYLEVLHLYNKDIPWLEERMKSNSKKHTQWTSPSIQNVLFEIVTELILDHFKKAVITNEFYGITIILTKFPFVTVSLRGE